MMDIFAIRTNERYHRANGGNPKDPFWYDGCSLIIERGAAKRYTARCEAYFDIVNNLPEYCRADHVQVVKLKQVNR